MNRVSLFSVVVVCCVASVAFAQDKKDAKPAAPAAAAPAAPPAPKLNAEGKKFVEAFLGNWTASDATFAMGENKMAGKVMMKCEKISAGWGTLCKATFVLKGMPPMTNTFLFGWDMGAGEGHMFEVSDAAEVHNHAGKWNDDKSATLVHQGKTVEGKDEKDSCTFTINSPKELRMECTGSQAGATMWTFVATAKK